MPEICRFYGIVIKMYYNEHNPPHIHVEYGEYEVQSIMKTITKSYDKLQKAEYLGGYKIKCFFKDNKSGTLDFTDFPERNGVFKKFSIDNGSLIWGDNELDIAPEIVYHKALGAPLPDWMEK